MEMTIHTQRERQATFADELAFTKIKQVLQVLRRGNHFTQGYLDIQELWAKGFIMLAERIRGAGRIRLADPLPSMAQQVAANRPSTLLQALPLYRLPYVPLKTCCASSRPSFYGPGSTSNWRKFPKAGQPPPHGAASCWATKTINWTSPPRRACPPTPE